MLRYLRGGHEPGDSTLHAEIDAALADCSNSDGEVTIERLDSLEYLDVAINEILQMFPVNIKFTDR